MRPLLFVLGCLISAGAARGYVVRTDDSGVYVIKWQSSPVNLQVKLAETANLSDGTSLSGSFGAALQTWNAQLGTVQLTAQQSGSTTYAVGNGVNEIVMDSKIDGEAFSNGTLAVTMSYWKGNSSIEADIVFNTAYTWDSYRGSLRRGVEDFRRVATHELGHVVGLLHPDEAGQAVTALMNSRESDIDGLQSDDIAGGQKLYGGPGFTPTNDNFAQGAALTLSGGAAWGAGANMAASREAGEPDHAGSTGRHSLWWQWTAAGNGIVVANTLGSDFDTVLAVYTGTTLAALTLVGSNDDEESLADNSSPQRKRTSKVTFKAAANTTYFFAVDGWGEASGVPDGYTGSVALGLSFQPLIPPHFTTQPTGKSVKAGETASFSANASGSPFPIFRWQRLPVGGAWTDLTTGGAFSVFGSTELRVNAVFSMDGDQFRCVATNAAGEETSIAVTLHVQQIPLPAITGQPWSDVVALGASAGFSVQATGATTYLWYHDGAAVAGQTGANLLIANVTAADAGEYYVILTNAAGSVRSSTVRLTVMASPSITVVNPTRQVVSPGQEMALSVTATGSGTVSYQWYHDGWLIAGATQSAYKHTVASRRDGGAYWVSVTDGTGSRHSRPSFVLSTPAATQLVGWGLHEDAEPSVPTIADRIVAVSDHQAVKADGSVLEIWHGVSVVPGLTDIVALGGTLALKATGEVVRIDSSRYAVPPGLRDVVAIADNNDHSLALRTDGTVVAWGDNAYGQTEVPPGLHDVVAIAAGSLSCLALKADGTVAAWGATISGEGNVPAGLRDVIAIAAEGQHALALKSDGTVVAWGSDVWGESKVPPGLRDIVAIAAGNYNCLALKADGTMAVWGFHVAEQFEFVPALDRIFALSAWRYRGLMLQDASSYQPPVLLETRVSNTTVVEGNDATFSVSARGGTPLLTYQWRRNQQPVVGATGTSLTIVAAKPADAGVYDVVVTNRAGATTSASAVLTVTPLPVVSNPAAARQALTIGQPLRLVIEASGAGSLAYQWFHDGRPIAGATAPSYGRDVTTVADLGVYWVTISGNVGVRYSGPIVVRQKMTKAGVVAWGMSPNRQTVVPENLDGPIAVSAGAVQALALKADGSVVEWGGKDYSWTGPPENLTDVVAISQGGSHALALKSDGTVVEWGSNFGGAETPPAHLEQVVAIAAGGSHQLALKADGTVVAWGYNETGQATVPPGLREVVAIAAGAQHSLALKRDGSLIAWGGNTAGQLKIPAGLASPVAISAADFGSLALRSDGTAVAWGDNYYGQNVVPAGVANVTGIAAGGDHFVVLKADGTLAAWGNDYYGNLAPSAEWNRVVEIAAANGYSLALRDMVNDAPKTYAGTYFGSTNLTGRRWALLVRPDRTATYLGAGRQGVIVAQTTIDAEGNFSISGPEWIANTGGSTASASSFGGDDRRRTTAVITYTVSGHINSGAVTGQDVGSGEILSGLMDTRGGSAPAGYYWAAALGTVSGALHVIVAPSGEMLAVVSTMNGVEYTSGTVSAAGAFAGSTTRAHNLSLQIIPAAHSIAGNVSDPDTQATTGFAGLSDTIQASTRLVNIAARAYCSTGNKVTIGGFVVSGRVSKRVLVRAVGPSLTAQGIGAGEVLLDPTIEVHDAIHGNSVIATNDNWGDNPNAAEINTAASAVGATALLGSDTKSAMLLLDLAPGVYSFVVNGQGATSGIVLLEIYDADATATGATFANIATRAQATTGNGVTIGGFVISGNAPKHVLLRAVGSTLTTQGLGVTEVLTDPTIELHDALHGNAIIATNDNWGDNANAASITATGARIGATPFDQSDTRSSALLVTLQPGVYSFIASGKSNTSGIVLVEVYDAD